MEEHPGSAAAHACSLLLRSASRKGSCAVLAQVPPCAQDLLSAISVVGCETDVVPGISKRLRSQTAAAERSGCCCPPLLAPKHLALSNVQCNAAQHMGAKALDPGLGPKQACLALHCRALAIRLPPTKR